MTAVSGQVPALLPLLYKAPERAAGKSDVHSSSAHCRVGILNEIGELLTLSVAVLLIGERPGLATAESLSAYMAYRPRKVTPMQTGTLFQTSMRGA